MEQHPIPQNVTQYQFRLIGDMTLKQFVMLAGGFLIGLACSKAPLIPAILRWPLLGLFAGGGAAIAFVPFEERSLDIWLINFIKALRNPTQYLWQKKGDIPEYLTFTRSSNIMPVPQIPQGDHDRLTAYLESLKVQPQNNLDTKEITALSKINAMLGTPATASGSSLLTDTFSMKSQSDQTNGIRFSAPIPQPPATNPSAASQPFPPQQPKPQEPPKPKPELNPNPSPLTHPILGNTPPSQSFPPATPLPGLQQPLPPQPQTQARPIVSTPLSSYNQQPQPHYPPRPGTPQPVFQQPTAINPIPQPPTAAVQQPVFPVHNQQAQPQVRSTGTNTQPTVSVTPPPFTPKPAPIVQQAPTQTYKVEAAPPLSPPMKVKSLYPAETPKKKVSGPQFLADVQMPISPDVPNVVIGMTLTKDEHLLANVILEIRESDGTPIRAIKSNQLGQFFIATPLKNGVYSLIAEHPTYKFDTITLEAKGQIIPPIKVLASEVFQDVEA